MLLAEGLIMLPIGELWLGDHITYLFSTAAYMATVVGQHRLVQFAGCLSIHEY